MTQLGEAYVPIRATLDKLDKDLADAKGKINGAMATIGGGIQSVGKLALAGTVTAIAAVGGAAILAGSQLISLASDAQEMQGKFDVVFANVGSQVTAQLDEFAIAAGRSKFELQGMAATFGDTLKPMGFTEEAAGDMAVTLSKLAVDLGSFNNMETDEALRRLQGTLIGSHENALAFGVVINENTLAAEMAANGWDELTGAELEAAKVQARINLLIAGTTDAQGDAIRTSEGWANQTRALNARLTDFATELGMNLLPIFTPLLSLLLDLAEGAMPAVSAAFDSIMPIMEGVSNAIRTFVGLIQEGQSPVTAFSFAWGILGNALGLTTDQISGVRELILGLLEQVNAIIDPIKQWVSENIELEDVLMALGIAIASFIIPAMLSVAASAAPIIAGFALLVGAVALVRTAWEENWGGIQEKTQAVIDYIVPLVTNAIANVKEWWAQNGDEILAKASQIWENIKTAVTIAIGIISSVITTVMAAVQEFWAANGDTILAKASEVWENIKTAVETAITTIQTIVTTIATALAEFWAAHGDTITQAAMDAWDLIKTTIQDAFDLIIAAWDTFSLLFEGDFEGFGESLYNLWKQAWELVIDYLTGLWAMIQPVLASLWTSLSSWWSGIDWGQLGRDIVDGIVNGLNAAGSAVGQALMGLAGAALDDVKNFLGISSPSKVMASLIGAPMGEGVVEGWANALSGDALVSGLQMAIAPVAMMAMDDMGGNNVTYSSNTTINTNQDPMRVLRASRHLDALGAL